MGNRLSGCCCCELFEGVITETYRDELRDSGSPISNIAELESNGWVSFKKWLDIPYSRFHLYANYRGGIQNLFDHGGLKRVLACDFDLATKDSESLISGRAEWVEHGRARDDVSDGFLTEFAAERYLRIRIGSKTYDLQCDPLPPFNEIDRFRRDFTLTITPHGLMVKDALVGPGDNPNYKDLRQADRLDWWYQYGRRESFSGGFFSDSNFSGTPLRWPEIQYHRHLLIPFQLPEFETAKLYLRPEITPGGQRLWVRGERTRFRGEDATDESGQPVTNFRMADCPPFEECEINGSSFTSPRWHLQSMTMPDGNRYQPPVPSLSARQAALEAYHYESLEEAERRPEAIANWSSNLWSPSYNYQRCETVIFDPLRRRIDGRFKPADTQHEALTAQLRTITRAFVRLNGDAPGDLVPYQSLGNFSTYWNSSSADFFETRPFQGGGTINNERPWEQLRLTIKLSDETISEEDAAARKEAEQKLEEAEEKEEQQKLEAEAAELSASTALAAAKSSKLAANAAKYASEKAAAAATAIADAAAASADPDSDPEQVAQLNALAFEASSVAINAADLAEESAEAAREAGTEARQAAMAAEIAGATETGSATREAGIAVGEVVQHTLATARHTDAAARAADPAIAASEASAAESKAVEAIDASEKAMGFAEDAAASAAKELEEFEEAKEAALEAAEELEALITPRTRKIDCSLEFSYANRFIGAAPVTNYYEEPISVDFPNFQPYRVLQAGSTKVLTDGSTNVPAGMSQNQAYAAQRSYSRGERLRRVLYTKVRMDFTQSVPGWDGEPPTISFDSTHLTELWYSSEADLGFFPNGTPEEETLTDPSEIVDKFERLPVLKKITSTITGELGFEGNVLVIPGDDGDEEVFNVTNQINTGWLRMDQEQAAADPTLIAFTIKPADDEIGHPEALDS